MNATMYPLFGHISAKLSPGNKLNCVASISCGQNFVWPECLHRYRSILPVIDPYFDTLVQFLDLEESKSLIKKGRSKKQQFTQKAVNALTIFQDMVLLSITFN